MPAFTFRSCGGRVNTKKASGGAFIRGKGIAFCLMRKMGLGRGLGKKGGGGQPRGSIQFTHMYRSPWASQMQQEIACLRLVLLSAMHGDA